VSPEAEGTLVRVRSEGEMAAPCGFSIGTENLYDGQRIRAFPLMPDEIPLVPNRMKMVRLRSIIPFENDMKGD